MTGGKGTGRGKRGLKLVPRSPAKKHKERLVRGHRGEKSKNN